MTESGAVQASRHSTGMPLPSALPVVAPNAAEQPSAMRHVMADSKVSRLLLHRLLCMMKLLVAGSCSCGATTACGGLLRSPGHSVGPFRSLH